jgi:pyruvate,water dikinase
LNDWRDIRKKESVCKINYELWIFLKKLCKYNKISLDIGSYIALHELNSFKLSKNYLKMLRKRTKEYYVMHFDEKDKLSWAYGKDGKRILDALEEKIKSGVKEIKGRTAYLGSVKGRVKIVNSISEFNKIKKGDVLVSIMTRPEMVPVMKKAAGIITDEGGITCHAAIVSRELKIPCIVGTQVATSVLKDGDLVEINGKTGVIKILK